LRYLAFLILTGVCGPAAADTVTFRDVERTISFSYDDKLWHESEDTPPDMVISIERYLLNGKSIAVCQLTARKSAYAARIEGHVHQERDHVVNEMMEEARARDPEAPPIESILTTAGSQQMIEVRKRAKYSSADVPPGMTVIALVTAYHGEAVMFKCGYPAYFKEKDGKQPFVESEIRAVMKTLSFGK